MFGWRFPVGCQTPTLRFSVERAVDSSRRYVHRWPLSQPLTRLCAAPSAPLALQAACGSTLQALAHWLTSPLLLCNACSQQRLQQRQSVQQRLCAAPVQPMTPPHRSASHHRVVSDVGPRRRPRAHLTTRVAPQRTGQSTQTPTQAQSTPQKAERWLCVNCRVHGTRNT